MPLGSMENMARLRQALFTWQHPVKRKRFVPGLVKNGDGAYFSYRQDRDLAEARTEGFAGYPAFPDFEKEYSAGVMESFSSRLPNPKRTDYEAYIRHWFIDPASKPTPLEVLAYTGGTLPRDGFGFLPMLPEVGAFDFVTELAGFRYNQRQLNVGEQVSFVPEPDNPQDAEAIAAVLGKSASGQRIGYAMRGLHWQFARWLRSGEVRAQVARINGTPDRPLVYVHVWVNARTP